MRFLIGLILLAFPIAEIWLLIKLADHYGWWLLFYLVVVGWLGLQLIKQEKLLLGDRMMQNLSAGGNPIKAMLGSARNLFAGILLMVPGVITDVIAVILLLIPIRQTNTNSQNSAGYQSYSQSDYQSKTQTHHNTSYRKAANDDVIEGEFTEIKDEPK